MSADSDNKSPLAELDLDLHFLPSWAQQPSDANRYAKYTGNEEAGGDDRRRGGGFGGRDRGPRREGGFRGPRPQGQGGPRPDGQRGPRPQGQGGGFQGGDRRGGGGGFRGRDDRRGGGFRRREERRELPPLPPIDVNFIPEEKGVESLARQIKLTGRAYPLFEIATLILKKPERYRVQLASQKKEGKAVAPLYVCALDDSIWLSEAEAMHHILDKHFDAFYSSEKIPTDPPKGTYTFVAQDAVSGAILGPPNYHDYQNKLRKLHQERFARVPFDVFKSRIKIVRDEAVVKKWVEEQSFRTEYTALNVPEPVKFQTREEVEKHFKETHFPNVVRVEESITLDGQQAQSIQHRPFPALIRRAWDEQSRFPIKVVNVLSQQFARHGLHFFKVNKSVTHVAVARPRYLDMEATPVSESVRKIVQFIETHPKTTRRKLIQEFAPNAPAMTAQPTAQAATPASTEAAHVPSEAAATTPTEGAAPAAGEATAAAQTPAAVPAAPTIAPSPELEALVRDLHWLVHQGHVIEFANGQLETAKKPAPRPEKKKKETPAAATAEAAAAPGAEGATAISTETPEAAPVESSASPTSEVPGESHAELPPEVPAAETATHPSGAETDTTVAEAAEQGEREEHKHTETPAV